MLLVILMAALVDWPPRERGDSGDCVTSIPSLPFPCLFCYHQHRLDCSYCCDHCFDCCSCCCCCHHCHHCHFIHIHHQLSIAQLQQQQKQRRLISSRFLLSLFNVNCNKSCRLFFFTLSHQPLSLSFLFPYHFRYLHHFSRCRRPCCTQSSGEGAPKRHQRSTRLHTLSNIDQLSNFFFFLL